MITEIYRDAPYLPLLRLQRWRHHYMCRCRRQRHMIDREWLMAVEHRHVYTLGRHAEAGNLIDPDYAADHKIDIYNIERGGDITYHGPGQLTLYPLIDLQRRGLGVKAYVTLLEQAVIDLASEYGVECGRIEGATGVWTLTPTPRKLCAIGIKCSRFVTMHGLALNISTDLTYFDHINPCGFAPGNVTSLERETNHKVEWVEATEKLIEILHQKLTTDD